MAEALRCQLTGYLSVQKQGLLSKSWVKKYCVFLMTASGCSPQIHVFDSEAQFKENPKDRKVLPLQNVKDVQISKEKPHAFTIVIKKEKIAFAAENEHDLNLWTVTLKQELKVPIKQNGGGSVGSDDEDSSGVFMEENIAYQSFEPNPSFHVTIEPNEASKSKNLHGSYVLSVNLNTVDLIDPTTKKILCQWPFRNIRRYGKTSTQLKLEAGRNCPSGAGYFEFKTEEGFVIADLISKNTLRMRSQDELNQNPLRSSGNLSDTAQAGDRNSSSQVVNRSVSVPVAADRKSVRVPDFASELTNVLKHQLEDPDHHEPRSSHSSSEQLNEEGKKDKHSVKKDKHDSKKEKQERKAAEQHRKQAEKLAEQERRAAEKQAKKDREKAQKEKNKKKKGDDKGLAKPTPAVANLYDSPENIHAYEEVDPLAVPIPTRIEPEPMYAEADDMVVGSAAKLKVSVLKPQTAPAQEVPLYSEPHKVRKDAWKQHARVEDNLHEEDYDLIKTSATEPAGASARAESMYVDSKSVSQEEDTYDHLGLISPAMGGDKHIYGMSSAKPIKHGKSQENLDMNLYEETLQSPPADAKKNVLLKKREKSTENAYEEPAVTFEKSDNSAANKKTAGKKSQAARTAALANKEPTPTPVNRAPPDGENDENIYNNIY